jgi:tetratricopeptide (TPR) repeat protein
MGYRKGIPVVLAMATALLVPAALAQQPPNPTPTPNPTPSAPANRTPPSSLPDNTRVQPGEEMVMFLSGRVATTDGTPIPNDLLIERICNNRVRQQVYPYSKGDFTMHLGSRTAYYGDVTVDHTSEINAARKDADQGIPRHELLNCELRASAPGFRPTVVGLAGLDTMAQSMDVGLLIVRRNGKVEGMTLSAIPYKAPKEARKAYEKGLDSMKSGKLADAQRHFEKAVGSYPQFADAWFQLGKVLEKENQRDAAGKAYAQAATVDSRFARPFLSLAALAFASGKWSEVLDLTRHVLDLDPYRHSGITGYVLDLDPLDYAEVYFYDAFANYQLKRFEEAEKGALRVERLDLRPRFPQVHLLLAELSARKGNYANAITETKLYLELLPDAPNASRLRERLSEYESLNGAVANGEKPTPK